MEQLVNRGFIVAAPDIIGIGETRGTSTYPGSPSYGAVIIGKNIVGIHAGDIIRVVAMLKNRENVAGDKIGAVAYDELCPALLHAAVFEPSISRTALIGAPISYKEIVYNKVHKYSISFIWGVAGALMAYDLPDLAGCVAPRKLLMVDIRDGMKVSASPDLLERELEFPRSVYMSIQAGRNLRIEDGIYDWNIDSILEWWME
jgi:hypothetical protein